MIKRQFNAHAAFLPQRRTSSEADHTATRQYAGLG
jgi:hypothetical protein